MVLIIGLFLFVNLLLLFINIICFCNKSRYFIYSMFINNIISVTTLLMCINYIKELMLKSDWTALLDIVPVIVPIVRAAGHQQIVPCGNRQQSFPLFRRISTAGIPAL